ncbi:MAG: transposase, partial [Coprothermobacterota bacterium]|nr:transposase [Coprothermobacterota bacterium]
MAGLPPDRIERRQVFDLPEPKLDSTERQAVLITCSCGCLNRAAFPPEVSAPVQNGPRLKPTFRGRAVHDFWKSYLKYDCKHAFCNGRLLRELIFLDEEQKQRWASPMIDHTYQPAAAWLLDQGCCRCRSRRRPRRPAGRGSG